MDSVIQKKRVLREKYIQYYLNQGREEGACLILKSLLTCKYGELTSHIINQLERANMEQLEKIGLKLLDETNLEDLISYVMDN